MGSLDHRNAQLHAISQLTFQQWFAGRAAFVRDWQPVAPDGAEQAVRADYIADKAWWYRRYEPGTHATFEQASEAAAAELPEPRRHPRLMPRGWLEHADAAITAAARHIPSRQWASTLIPADVLEYPWGNPQ